MARPLSALSILVLAAAIAACSHKAPTTPGNTPNPSPVPGSGTTGTETPRPATPVERPAEAVATPPDVTPPVAVDPLTSKSLDELNRSDALKPVFFQLDSDQLDDTARQVLTENSQVLRKYGSWIITIEGHCDERGSAEYNLALGERRAQAARNYLVSLGVQAERIRTISYGKEFPFDAGHDESAWSQNRRAQLMVTAR